MEYLIPILICALISMAGAFTQRVSGFGYGIVVMMVYPYIMAYGSSATLSGVVSIIFASYVAFTMRKHIKIKQVVLPLITYTVMNYLATSFIATADTSLLKRILGGALILLSIYFLIFSKRIKLRANNGTALIAGSLSGVMAGLFAMGGPPMVLYFLSANDDSTDDYLATIQLFFALSNIISTVTRAIKGMFTQEVFIMLVPAIAGMLLGTFIGKKVYTKLSSDIVKKCVYGFMAFSGLISLIMG